MLRNFFKTSLRSLLKNPLSSFINVFGLALAIGVSMVTYTYLSLELGMENQHSKQDKLFMLTSLVDRDGEAALYGLSPAPIGLKLQDDFSQIRRMTRIRDRSVVVKRGDNVFRERVRLADPSFLEMFDFNLTKGGRSSLEDLNSVVLNDKTAKKYFGDEDPMGKTIQMRFPGGKKSQLTVTGVANIPALSTSLEFDFLANFDLMETKEDDFKNSDWSRNILATFIELDDPSEVEYIAQNIDDYRGVVNSAQPEWQIQEFTFEPLSTLYERSNDIRWDISSESDTEGRVILSIIAIMILVLACLNYINIAVASATKRLKEIGVRKVVGANRAMLIIQFITENILLSAVALGTGFLIAKLFFLPGLGNLFGIEFRLEALTIEFFLYLIGILLVTALASGAYPALYISKFQAVSIFRGRLRFGQKNLLTKVFLTFQFILAMITVVCGIAFTMNTEWQNSRPWGYNKEETIYVRLADDPTYETLKNELSGNPNIAEVSGGSNHLGAFLGSVILQFPDRKVEAFKLDVEANYADLMDLELVSGRNLRENYESDKNAVLVNETFVKKMQWEEPIGKTFKYDSTSYTIAGVMKDFHYYNFWNDIESVFLRVVDKDFRYLVARVQDENNIINTFEEVESTWSQLYPELPFRGDYQEQLYAEYFQNVNGHKAIMITVAIIAMILSCFGLYGLVSLNVAGRRKEFSIRKVLGARLGAIANAVSSHFLIYLIVSLFIGAPVSYFLIEILLGVIYTYHMPMTVFPVVLAVLMIAVTILLTISTQINKVSTANPTEGLRME